MTSFWLVLTHEYTAPSFFLSKLIHGTSRHKSTDMWVLFTFVCIFLFMFVLIMFWTLIISFRILSTKSTRPTGLKQGGNWPPHNPSEQLGRFLWSTLGLQFCFSVILLPLPLFVLLDHQAASPHSYKMVAPAPGITTTHLDQGQHRVTSVCVLIEIEKPFLKAPSSLSLLSHSPELRHMFIPKLGTHKENGTSTLGSSRLYRRFGDRTHFLRGIQLPGEE